MGRYMAHWIWEHKDFPTNRGGVDLKRCFPWSREGVQDLLVDLASIEGVLSGISSTLDHRSLDEIEVDSVTDEILDSSGIEGKMLMRDSVRESVARMISRQTSPKPLHSTRHTDNLAVFAIDAARNNSDLEIQRLHNWHTKLFRFEGGEGIKVGEFRDSDIRVIEDTFSRRGKITKYLAPPPKRIQQDLDMMLRYVNTSELNHHIKSALAHLWFVIIHPYEDGNGRVARAISDYILYRDGNTALFSLSSEIRKHQIDYYEILHETTNLQRNRHFDFTMWVRWHLERTKRAMERSIEKTRWIVQIAKHLDECREKGVGKAQQEFLTMKIRRMVEEKKSLDFSNKEYRGETSTSQVTASRQIKKMLDANCIRRVEGKNGRSTRYQPIVPIIEKKDLKGIK